MRIPSRIHDRRTWLARVPALLLLAALALLRGGPPLGAASGMGPGTVPPPMPDPVPVHLPLISAFPPPPPTSTPLPKPSATPRPATALRVVGWNIESGGSNRATIARQIEEFEGVDLWGLSEVTGTAEAQLYALSAAHGEGAPFGAILGTTGDARRLLILYNQSRFALLGQSEISSLAWRSRLRAPLYAHLRERATGQELLFMVNHLDYDNSDVRLRQASGLYDWAETQALPVVAVGDYNFAWSVTNGDADHDAGFDRMAQDGRWRWLRPPVLVTTSCHSHPCEQQVLDFVFVTGAARGWPAQSSIVVRPGDFPDTALTSDHRPVEALLTLPP